MIKELAYLLDKPTNITGRIYPSKDILPQLKALLNRNSLIVELGHNIFEDETFNDLNLENVIAKVNAIKYDSDTGKLLFDIVSLKKEWEDLIESLELKIAGIGQIIVTDKGEEIQKFGITRIYLE